MYAALPHMPLSNHAPKSESESESEQKNRDHPRDDWVPICTSGYCSGVGSNWLIGLFVLYSFTKNRSIQPVLIGKLQTIASCNYAWKYIIFSGTTLNASLPET